MIRFNPQNGRLTRRTQERQRVKLEFERQILVRLQNGCRAAISNKLMLVVRVLDARQGT